jgi:hypothetical protein
MEKGYVVQGEVYAEPVLEAEVVAAEPIMGEVVGEVVPSRKRWTARRGSRW